MTSPAVPPGGRWESTQSNKEYGQGITPSVRSWDSAAWCRPWESLVGTVRAHRGGVQDDGDTLRPLSAQGQGNPDPDMGLTAGGDCAREREGRSSPEESRKRGRAEPKPGTTGGSYLGPPPSPRAAE